MLDVDAEEDASNRMALLSTSHFEARKLIKNMSITGWIKQNGNKLIKLSLWVMIKQLL